MVLATVSLLSYAKVGAAPNYLLEPLAAAALWGMESLGRLMNGIESPPTAASRGQRIAPEAAAWAIVLLLLVHAGWLWNPGWFKTPPIRKAMHSSLTPTRADVGDCRWVLARVRATGGEVLSEEPIFALLAGSEVVFQPFIMKQLAREGRWDQRLLLEMLARRRFGSVIVTEDLATGDVKKGYERYTPEMVKALRRHYKPTPPIELTVKYRITDDNRIIEKYFAWRRYYLWKPNGQSLESKTAVGTAPPR